ncbi:MAG: putative cytosol aminopeptidase [Parcubacteria group bacterium GW2011_GWA2_47_26]|nr:MAG: putative cytosol aminopeptidase [Parcubacteria group bacterium GW2011_GWA2_47_26]
MLAHSTPSTPLNNAIMKVQIKQAKLEKFPCDLLVLKWVQGQKMDGSTGAVDRALGGLIFKMMKEEGFKGKEGEVMTFPVVGRKIGARKVMVLGLGEQKNVTVDCLRRSAARIVKEARRQHARRVGTIFMGTGAAGIDPVRSRARAEGASPLRTAGAATSNGIDPFVAAKAITEGALLGRYTYTKYKSKEVRRDSVFPSELVIVTAGVHEKALVHNPSQPPQNSRGGEKFKIVEAERGIREGKIYADATIFSRDLVNEPASNMTPRDLADMAEGLAKDVAGMEVKIYDKNEIEEMGMGAYLGVAKGSDHPPYFIHLTWRPRTANSKTKTQRIAIIGKGITFDSGGLSLKPAGSMESMKTDMAGCAAMLGIFSALPKMKPNVEVHGISAVCENMPSGRAMKPGDIVRTMSGKTIEVLNTDAEGRLTLADALTYARRLKPQAIVDLATLTGACIVALGEEVAGYMGNNRELLDGVKKVAENAGERIWELPLVDEYREFIKSRVADYCNITPGKKGAGAITAGLLLQEFAGKTPWVHLDIAGPAWAEKEVIPYMSIGGTGFGVRTILELLKTM